MPNKNFTSMLITPVLVGMFVMMSIQLNTAASEKENSASAQTKGAGWPGSPDEARWNAWHGLESAEDKLKKAS